MCSQKAQPNLDERTVEFTVEAREDIKPGDSLVVRQIESSGSQLRVSAVTERAIRDEAAKLFG